MGQQFTSHPDYPFQLKPLKKPSLFKKILGIPVRENLAAEIHNLLARKGIMDVSEEEISKIAESYKVNLERERLPEIEEIYRNYYEYCLYDRKLSQEEREKLAHLQRILKLADDQVTKIHTEVGAKIYSNELADALIDGQISSEEEEFLAQLRQELELPDEIISMKLSARFTKLS